MSMNIIKLLKLITQKDCPRKVTEKESEAEKIKDAETVDKEN